MAEATPQMCEQSVFDRASLPKSKDMGFDLKKTRFQPANVSGLSKEDVPKLKLKWAFGFPSAIRARSLPLLAGGFLFVGSHDGTVYALNPDTACVHWTFAAAAEVRTALTTNDWSVGSEDQVPILYFGDIIANAYAINAATGELIWKTKVDDHDNATVTGSPVFHSDRLYVPVSSLEVASAAEQAMNVVHSEDRWSVLMRRAVNRFGKRILLTKRQSLPIKVPLELNSMDLPVRRSGIVQPST